MGAAEGRSAEGRTDSRSQEKEPARSAGDRDKELVRACVLFERVLEARSGRIGGTGLLELVLTLLGPAVTVCDASRYIYVYARQLGYDIPPYPLAGCGEIKEFFAWFGTTSVPGFYERAGVDRETYADLTSKTAVAVRNEQGARKLFIAAVPFCRIERMIDLRREREIDALARAALPSVLGADAALALADGMLSFLLAQGDPAAF